jgi:hypothetical protein
VARNKHVEKEGKEACRRKNNVVHRKTSLTMRGLWFFTIL